MNLTSPVPDSIARLTGAGAHLVLCRADKRPLWRGWQRRRPGADTALAHLDNEKGPLGIVPASLRSTALDVDTGDPIHPVRRIPAVGGPPIAPWASRLLRR